MKPDPIVERLWPGRAARIEPLGGGITNHNFRVEVDREAFVLRIGGKDTGFLGIDRAAEHDASLAAAEAGVGPEVVRFVEPEGYLVTRFIEGAPVPAEAMRTPEGIERVAGQLRRFHGGRPIAGSFDSFSVLESYRRAAEDHGVEIPAAFERARGRAGEINRARAATAVCPCHNDLLNANFIDDGHRIRIVDWEYAGMGDRFFDLANLSVNHDFAPEHDDALLESYFGEPTAERRAALTLMRFMSDFREAMWGVVQQGISELDFDYVAYAEEHFERMERTAATPAFRRALERAGL